jgi:CheY-like chemotaxis protein
MTRVLIIEDDATLRSNIIDVLDMSGYEVISAPDGAQGVQAAREHQPDVIVCDVRMPGLDGFGVLRTLRQDPATAAIPLIFLTARAELADRRAGIEAGAAGYITKPFSISELIEAVAKAAGDHRATSW